MDAVDWFAGASIIWAAVAVWLWWQHGKITILNIWALVVSYAGVIGLIVVFDLILSN